MTYKFLNLEIRNLMCITILAFVEEFFIRFVDDSEDPEFEDYFTFLD
ncbi:MAG: hypothetical protein KGD65_14805 [Candidatus Lokiarchaeota archaeon]|nr:hypothetical protein [Candidatus Lokiarchaeota archaeon]